MRLIILFLIITCCVDAAKLYTTISTSLEKTVSLTDAVITTDFTTQMEALGSHPYILQAVCMQSNCSIGTSTSATSVNAQYVTSGYQIDLGMTHSGTINSKPMIYTTKWNGKWFMRMLYKLVGY